VTLSCFTITIGRTCDLNILGTCMEASVHFFWNRGLTDPPGARVALEGETLAECKTYPKEPLLMTCSDLLSSHQRKCVCAWPAWQQGGSLVAER
jgi:hypothetical protein